MRLDIGEMPHEETGTLVGENEDPEALARITAHAIARMADRIPFSRKLSRHLEGTEKRSGIMSDIGTALITMYKRNPDVIEQLAASVAQDVKVKQAARKAPTNGGTVQ